MSKKIVALMILTLGLYGGFASAGGGTDVLTCTDATTSDGGSTAVAVQVISDNTGTIAYGGWSFGLCHDSAALQIDSADATPETLDLNLPSPVLGFLDQAVVPGVGYSMGVIIDFFGNNTLGPISGWAISDVNYTYIGAYPATDADPAITTSIDFCDTIGSPPVETLVVLAGGAGVVPTQNSGTVSAVGAPPQCAPEFSMAAGNGATTYAGVDGTGAGIVVVDISINEIDATMMSCEQTYVNQTQGFSLGLSNDPTFLTAAAVDPAGELVAMNGGTGPAFFTAGLFADGITLGVVFSLMGTEFVEFDASKVVANVVYNADASTLANADPMTAATMTDLTFTDSLGTPAVETLVVVGGDGFVPSQAGGTVTLTPVYDLDFIRGDCNDDGIVNIADGVWIISQVALAGPAGPCAEACNANDDTEITDLSDAIFIFSYQFSGGAAPAAPFPGCDLVMGADCAASSCP